MLAVKQKICSIFQEREVTFFDCFQSVYDPLKSNAMISISEFKTMIRQLNLPLSV